MPSDETTSSTESTLLPTLPTEMPIWFCRNSILSLACAAARCCWAAEVEAGSGSRTFLGDAGLCCSAR